MYLMFKVRDCEFGKNIVDIACSRLAIFNIFTQIRIGKQELWTSVTRQRGEKF